MWVILTISDTFCNLQFSTNRFPVDGVRDADGALLERSAAHAARPPRGPRHSRGRSTLRLYAIERAGDGRVGVHRGAVSGTESLLQ